jgi:hypothetical protein
MRGPVWVSGDQPMGRVSLSELRRLLAEQRDGAAQHAIQRTWRFTANKRLPIRDAMQWPLLWLFAAAGGGRSALGSEFRMDPRTYRAKRLSQTACLGASLRRDPKGLFPLC